MMQEYFGVMVVEQLLIYQICSMLLHKEMTFKISRQHGTNLHNLQVKYPQREFSGEFLQDENT